MQPEREVSDAGFMLRCRGKVRRRERRRCGWEPAAHGMCRLTALISGGAWSEKPKKCGACHRRDGRPLFAQIVLYSLTLLSCSLRGLLSVLALSSTRASRLALYSLALTLRMFLIALYFDPFRVLLPAHPVGSEFADVDRSLLRSTLRLALGSPEPPCSQLAHLVRPLANRRSLLRQPASLLSALNHSTLALNSPGWE